MFGPSIQTKGRGFSGFPIKPSNADPIGSVVYAPAPPDSNYRLADGSSVKAADFPLLAQKWGGAPGYNNRKIADPATLPSATAYNYCAAISPDGQYAAVVASTAQNMLVYQITDAGLVYLQSLTVGNASTTMAGPEAMAFSPDSSYLAVGNSDAPCLYIFRRAPGATNFTNTPLTITGVGVASAPTAMEFAEDNSLLIGYGVAGYGYAAAFTLSGTTVTRVGSSAFPGSLPGPPQQITRTKDAKRWAVRVTAAPYVQFYDHAGGGVFTVATGTLPTAGGATTSICLSPSGDYFTRYGTLSGIVTNVFEVWKRDPAGVYSLKMLLNPPSSADFMSFTPDERQFWAGFRAASTQIVYQPANGNFLELARGTAVGAFPVVFFQRKQARNGKATLALSNAAPYIAVYLEGPSMPDIPLPAYPNLGSGGNILKPYIKVK